MGVVCARVSSDASKGKCLNARLPCRWFFSKIEKGLFDWPSRRVCRWCPSSALGNETRITFGFRNKNGSMRFLGSFVLPRSAFGGCLEAPGRSRDRWLLCSGTQSALKGMKNRVRRMWPNCTKDFWMQCKDCMIGTRWSVGRKTLSLCSCDRKLT